MTNIAPADGANTKASLTKVKTNPENPSTQVVPEHTPPPLGSFDKAPFPLLLSSYNHTCALPPTIDLTQSFLMTMNMKQAAH